MRHGWNSTSYQLMNPGMRHWFSSDGEAFLGYVQCAGVRVVAGAPVCEYGRLSDVALEFEEDARRARASTCYFSVEPRWLELVRHRSEAVLVGSQPVWNAAEWADTFDARSSLRAQVNRARNKGVTVRAVAAKALADGGRVSAELQRVRQSWLGGHGLPPLGFLTAVNLAPDSTGDGAAVLDDRRLYVAYQHGGAGERAVGYLVASPIPLRRGWLVEQVVRDPEAPNGTSELLIDTACRALACEGAERLTLGLAPLSRRHQGGEGSDGPVWAGLAFAWAYAHGRRFYNFAGLEAFKEKFRPHAWEPVYMVAGGLRLTPRELYAVAAAFTGGRPLRALAQGVGRALFTC